jgi:hypothetical protein
MLSRYFSSSLTGPPDRWTALLAVQESGLYYLDNIRIHTIQGEAGNRIGFFYAALRIFLSFIYLDGREKHFLHAAIFLLQFAVGHRRQLLPYVVGTRACPE